MPLWKAIHEPYLISCLQLCVSSVSWSHNFYIRCKLLIDSWSHCRFPFLIEILRCTIYLHPWHMWSTLGMRWWCLCVHHHKDQLELGVADVLAISCYSRWTLGNRSGSLQNYATSMCFFYFRCSNIAFELSGAIVEFQNKMACLRALLLHPLGSTHFVLEEMIRSSWS